MTIAIIAAASTPKSESPSPSLRKTKVSAGDTVVDVDEVLLETVVDVVVVIGGNVVGSVVVGVVGSGTKVSVVAPPPPQAARMNTAVAT